MSLTLILPSYIVIAFLVFGYFLWVFLTDKSTPNTHMGSWIVLGLATLLWPIVLPLAYLERRVKKPTKVTDADFDLRLEDPHQSYGSSSPRLSASVKTSSGDADIRRSA